MLSRGSLMGNKQKRHRGIVYPTEIYELKKERKNIPFDIAKKYFNGFNSKMIVEYVCVECGKEETTQFRRLKEGLLQ
jgi:hypothetical protein